MSAPLAPKCKTTYANQVQELYRGSAILLQGNQRTPVEAHAKFHWLPTPYLLICVNGPYDIATAWNGADTKIVLIDKWDTAEFELVPVKCVIRESGVHLDFHVKSWPDSLLNISSNFGLFHIANLRKYAGEWLCNDSRRWQGRAELICSDWKLTLDELCPEDVPRSEEATGGFQISHVARFTTRNGAPFTASNASPFLSCVGQFLSFCNGSRCGPILCFGVDKENDSVASWVDWRVQRTWPAHTVISWWNDEDGQNVFMAFGRFYDLWCDETWSEPLRNAIHWYLEANRPHSLTETSIVLTQLAFEGLADSLIVEDRELLSAEGLKKLEAHDKLRLLLGICEIPLEIPSALPELKKVAAANSWNAAKAICEVRNCHVHPTKANREILKKRSVDSLVKFQVAQMSLHYLERSMLYLIGVKSATQGRLKT